MNRSVALAALLFASSLLSAQTAPRGPVLLSDRGGDTPAPGPDPSGIYSGAVTFTFGDQGSFTQTWRIPLKSRPCPTCPPGQYTLSGTNYDLIEYDGGAIDRGSVTAVVGGDGTGHLELNGTNCSYISFGLGGVSTYRSGAAGPSPGADFKVSNNRMTGRLSGWDCYGNVVVADLNLLKQSGTPQTCPYYGGSYFGAYANSCGGSQAGDVILTQSGCSLSGYSAGAATAIQGTITSPTTATFQFESTVGCGGGSGTATISNGVIKGTYSGTSQGGPGCCPPGPFTGSFTLTP